jgi:hypothetical protein
MLQSVKSTGISSSAALDPLSGGPVFFGALWGRCRVDVGSMYG